MKYLTVYSTETILEFLDSLELQLTRLLAKTYAALPANWFDFIRQFAEVLPEPKLGTHLPLVIRPQVQPNSPNL
jgi:hypothetical protein